MTMLRSSVRLLPKKTNHEAALEALEALCDPPIVEANGQEAPEAIDINARQKQELDEADARQKKRLEEADARQKQKQEEQQAALSKSQQEEATKNAERRKAFDKERYQAAPPKNVAAATSSAPINSTTSPSTGMVMGLNQAPTNAFSHDDPFDTSFLDLPGGILDDAEFFQASAQFTTAKKKQTHDDIESTGFDEDDEKLMREILQDFDD